MKEQFQKQPSVIIPPLDYKEENKIDKQLQNRQYETYFERTLKSQISTLEISPDEKYFIVGTNDKEIQIFELNVQQIIKTITLNNKAMVIKFTNDSKYIFCGDQGGFLNIYEISNFKEIFNKQLHSSSLNSFKIIDNSQIITCSSDKSIIITNIQQNEQLLQIKYAHNEEINCVDHDQQQDVIMSCSVDQSIKFFNRKNGQFLFQSTNAHKFSIQKIQFIQKNKTLISSNLNQLKLWQIDYKNQKLIKYKEISDDSMIFNFTFLSNCNEIIIINKQHISIYDQDLKLIQKIEHQVKLDIICSFYNTQQLDSIKYIVIIKGDYIKIMKQQKNL